MSRVVVIADRDKSALVQQTLEAAGLDVQLFVPERGLPEEPAAALVAYREAMQRRALSGVLAAGAAHDINNLIMALRLRVYDLPADTPAVDDLSEGIDRIRELTSNLTAFARPTAKTEDTDLTTIARRAVTLVAPLIRGLATLDQQLANEPLPLHGNYGQLTQLAVNLLLNAGQAIDRSGVGERITLQTLRRDDSAVMRVTDDGPGMTAEQVERAFEPFVSWSSTGSGLGLYLCRHVVTVHGGTIQIEGGDDNGTEVTVALPLRQAAGG